MPSPDCVAVLVTDPADHVLLVLNRRRSWELPGGSMKPREAPSTAAIREVQEETGLQVQLLSTPPRVIPRAAADGSKSYVFYARNLGDRPVPNDPDGFISVARWFSRENVRRLLPILSDVESAAVLREWAEVDGNRSGPSPDASSWNRERALWANLVRAERAHHDHTLLLSGAERDDDMKGPRSKVVAAEEALRSFGANIDSMLSGTAATTSGPTPDEGQSSPPTEAESRACSFCGKPKADVDWLVAGPRGIHICNVCVQMCCDCINDAASRQATPPEAEAAFPDPCDGCNDPASECVCDVGRMARGEPPFDKPEVRAGESGDVELGCPARPAGHIYHADPLVERLCREWLVEGQTANDLEGVLARTRAACLKFSAGYHAHRKCIEGWTQPIPGQENWTDMRARLVCEATEAGGQAAGEATAEGLVFGFDWVARTLASALLETGEMPDVREDVLVKQAATAIRGRRSLTSENAARLADVERILASPKGACTVGDLLGHLRWAAEILAASRDVAWASTEKQTPAKVDPTDMRRFYGLVTACHAGRDGECNWKECPQTRDGEPKKSGRHCPLDKESDE